MQKTVQTDKTFCLSQSISQEQIFIFQVVSGVKGQKMVQNDKKIMSVVLHISGTIHHMIVIYGTHV